MNVDLASTLWYFSIESSKLNEGGKMLESEKKIGGLGENAKMQFWHKRVSNSLMYVQKGNYSSLFLRRTF